MSRYDLGPKPHLGYTESLIERAAERRLDAPWLAACQADPLTQTYVIGGEMILLKKGGGPHDPLFTPQEARKLAPRLKAASERGYSPAWFRFDESQQGEGQRGWTRGFDPYWIAFHSSVTPASSGSASGGYAGGGAAGGGGGSAGGF